MKKKVIIILALWFLIGFFTRMALGAPLVGQDYLALQSPNFDVDSAVQFIEPGSAIGSLDFTFGTNTQHIEKVLASGKFNFYRVHLIDGTCISNRNCGTYSPFRTFSLQSFEAAVLSGRGPVYTYIANHVPYYCNLKSRYPNVEIRISPVLEHRLNVQAYRLLADAVLKACPGMGLVNNAVTGNGERYAGAFLESHDGFNKPRDIVSFDGLDATDADIQSWLKRTGAGKVSFVWSRSYNCRLQKGWLDPRARKACPTKKTFELLAHIADVRPIPVPSPTFSCTFKKLVAPSIWKPLAEDTNSTDLRGGLPVALVPFKPRQNVYVVGANGVRLCVMPYYGSYQGSLNRYYSGTGCKLSGYQMEKKAAIINSNNPYVWLKQGNQCIGPIVAGRRGGSFK